MRQETQYTETCRAVWPSLSSPHPKFGGYKVQLVMDQAQAAKIQKMYEAEFERLYQEECQKQGKKQLKRATSSPFKPETRDDGTETGNILVQFKEKHEYKDKASGQTIKKRLRIVDSQKKDIKAEVWAASEIKVAYVFSPWYAAALGFGVKLKILAVQVIKLVTKGDGGAAINGFDIEDDGYVAEEDSTPSEFPATDAVNQATVEQSNVVAPAIKGNF